MPAACRRTSSRTSHVPELEVDNSKIERSRKVTGKRSREPADTTVESEPAPAKKARALTNKPTHEAQVRHSARGRKPTTKASTQKRVRRTPEEVQAAKAAVEEAKKQKLVDAEEAQRRLAQMDDDDDAERAYSAANTIKRMSDMTADLNGEEFVGFHEMLSSSSVGSESDSEPVDFKLAYMALLKKMGELEKKIGGGDGGKKKRTEGGKNAPNKDSAYASGLLPDSGTYTVPMAREETSQSISISVGGLDDNDADAVNPYSFPQATSQQKAARVAIEFGKRDLSRQNQLVTIVSEEKELPPVKRNTRPSKSLEPGRKCAPTGRKSAQSPPPVKAEEKENALDHIKAVGDNQKAKNRRVLNPNNVRISDLPDFAKDQSWKKTFLPTLYSKFFTSSKPFSEFVKGSKEFLAILQTVVKEVYPKIKYKVSASDPIHALAYNRINEKKSHIGFTAIDMVKRHIDTLEGDKPTRDWLLWASRGDGPLFFGKPVAPDAPLDRNDPKYVHPGERLMTKFIIDLVRPNLRIQSGSVSGNGHPRGLIALVMAALERAVQIHLHPSEAVPEFSSTAWGSKTEAYYRGLNNVQESRWEEFFKACKGETSEKDDIADEEYQANISFMDHNRAVLFDFPSPVKTRHGSTT